MVRDAHENVSERSLTCPGIDSGQVDVPTGGQRVGGIQPA
jgi:hypothetical protein